MGLPAFDMSAFDAVQATVAAPPRVATTIFMRADEGQAVSLAEHQQRIKNATDKFVELTYSWRAELIVGINNIERIVEAHVSANDLSTLRALLEKHLVFMSETRNSSKVLEEGDQGLLTALAEAMHISSIHVREALPFFRKRQKVIVSTARLRAAMSARAMLRFERIEKTLQDAIATNSPIIASVLPKTIETFGSRHKAWSWLLKRSAALSNRAPIDLLQSENDSIKVGDLLARIDHGLAA